MTVPKVHSPQDIRAIFGRNLQSLAARAGSVSQLCRDLGINRTQFLRYLNGSAFPRPDVLQRICAHFGVDARILLEPIDDIPPPSDHQHLAALMDRTHPEAAELHIPETMFPSGLFRIWRRSFALPDRAVVSLARVWREGRLTLIKSYEPQQLTPYAFDMARPPVAPVQGFVMRAEDGVVALSMPRGQRLHRFTYLRQGHAGFGTLHAGYATLARDRSAGQLRAVGVLAEHLLAPHPPLIRLARETGYRPMDQVPALFARHLMQDHPN